MTFSEEHPIKCSYENCPNSIKGSYWDAVKAHDEGWFRQKDGTNWCPEHTPAWVAEWRYRKSQFKEQK